MNHQAKSIRPFIGAKDFDLSRSFYRDLGFEEVVLFPDMSLFTNGSVAFYLQKYYIQDWVDNSMIFLEVEDLDKHWQEVTALDLPSTYPMVRVSGIQYLDWGREYFVHDPSGILWHFGHFRSHDNQQPAIDSKSEPS